LEQVVSLHCDDVQESICDLQADLLRIIYKDQVHCGLLVAARGLVDGSSTHCSRSNSSLPDVWSLTLH
jgi:hypothetical protein